MVTKLWLNYDSIIYSETKNSTIYLPSCNFPLNNNQTQHRKLKLTRVYEFYPKVCPSCKVRYAHCEGLYGLFFILYTYNCP